MKKYTTLKDIANSLKISTATVSRALANRWDVNEETKKIVLEEAKRLKYKPNPIALKLQNGRSKTLGIVIPEFQSSFFPRVIAGIQHVAEERGYQLLITQSQESSIIEANNLKLLENNMVEGILISVAGEGQNTQLYDEILESGTPIVFFNRICPKTQATKIIIDDFKMAFFATEHLIYSGFKNIIHFSGPDNLTVSKERKRGFLEAMKKHHLEVSDTSVIKAGIVLDEGYETMRTIITHNKLPEAIFCFNDPIALGALKALKEAEIKCPEEVALVGFSETEVAQLTEPTLTSILQPTFEMGAEATRQLIDMIEKPDEITPQTICLTAKLNIRRSSIKA